LVVVVVVVVVVVLLLAVEEEEEEEEEEEKEEEEAAAAAVSAAAHVTSVSTGSRSKSPTGGTEPSTCVAPSSAAIPAGFQGPTDIDIARLVIGWLYLKQRGIKM
jgi:hypothetical protein